MDEDPIIFPGADGFEELVAAFTAQRNPNALAVVRGCIKHDERTSNDLRKDAYSLFIRY